ncbi:MAG: hypothetical protein ACI80K_003516 [Paracoccaceae bacterium]
MDVTPIIGPNIDSVNLSVDSQATYLAGDFFGPTRYFIYIVDKASVLNGGTPLATHTTITGRHSMGAPVNYDANDDPAVPGKFWGHHEYRGSGWRTRIASFDACSGSVENYCVPSPNSVGAGASIQANGSMSLGDNSLQLVSIGSAPGTFGVFFYGDARDLAPTGDGVRCVGGTIFRLGVTQSDIFGRSFFNLDVTMPSNPAALITAGSTWNFQYFYRDIVPMGSGLNFSDAVAIQFCD